MALEAAALDQCETFFEFLRAANRIFREDVFIEWVARRTVNVEEAVIAVAARQLAQKVPAAGVVLRIALGAFQLLPGPKNGAFGSGIEPFGIEQRTLVVIAQEAHLALHGQIDALARIGTVADNIAQAEDLGDPLGTNVGQHSLKCFEVAVNVADEGSLHAPRLYWKRYSALKLCAVPTAPWLNDLPLYATRRNAGKLAV